VLTPWGEAVRPENAWCEHPRPQLVRAGWTSLNGTWSYAIRPRHEPVPRHWDGEILVPFCVESRLSGVGRRVAPGERLWYQRTFTPPTGQRTLLHFGAVDWHAAIFVNGAYVASHEGGFDPFTLDVTEFLKSGDNDLVVAVDDPTSAGEQPRGKQHLNPKGIWYTPVTGIWQTVWLEPVPSQNHIAEVRATGGSGCAHIETLLARPTRDPTLAVSLRVRRGERVVATALGRADRTISVNIPEPEPWSPERPTLYHLDVELVRVGNPLPGQGAGEGVAVRREVPLRGATEAARYAQATIEEVVDSVQSYFGLREIHVGSHPESGRPTLLLNGTPVFHLATLDQGFWPDGLLTPPADAAIVHEIAFLKAAGFNAVRKHIKVEPARYYWHCDRLGLMVWQDMPSGFLPAQFVAPNDEREGLRTAISADRHERELARMVRTLRAHPSIVVWVLHNEGWGQFDSERLTAFVRGLDPSRPIDATSGWLDVGAGDFVDRHDYAAEPAAPAGDGRRALVLGEFGGVGWPIADHLWDPAMRNWGYQTFASESEVKAAYARALAAVGRARETDGLCAAVYTQTTDVEGEVNGLLTYDRRVEKLPRAWLAEQHRACLR
jgi:beta-galactosidase/beta-glucuronidase